MNRLQFSFAMVGIMLVILVGMMAAPGAASPVKVLVVMSYDEAYSWSRELRDGIEQELPDDWDIRYVYLDTKRYLEQGKIKAQEAYALSLIHI